MQGKFLQTQKVSSLTFGLTSIIMFGNIMEMKMVNESCKRQDKNLVSLI